MYVGTKHTYSDIVRPSLQPGPGSMQSFAGSEGLVNLRGLFGLQVGAVVWVSSAMQILLLIARFDAGGLRSVGQL